MDIYSRILITEFATVIGNKLKSLLASKKEITLAVPGGSTPKRYLDEISKLDLDWSRIHIFLTDERWVDNITNDSNELLVRQHLLQNKAAQARLYGIYQEGLSPDAGARICSEKLKKNNSTLDLIILGMGIDTHIASIFPGNQLIFHSEGIYAAFSESSILQSSRVSLTPTALVHSTYVILAISGPDKENALTSIWDTNDRIRNPVLILKDRPADRTEIYSLQE